MEKAYKNLGYFFLLLIPLTFLGFYKTYFIQFPSFEENTIGRIGPHIFEWSEIVTQNIQYGIIYLILIGLIFYDKRNKNNYRPYLLILTTWIIHLIIFNMIF